MSNKPSFYIKKTKSGLMEGILVHFYEWRDTPPLDTQGLAPVAETVFVHLNHLWRDKPHEKVRSEKYLAEFKGFIATERGTYRFHVVSSGGVKIWVDENLVVDSWVLDKLRKLSSNPIPLNRGFHRFRLLYCNAKRPGWIRVTWEKPGGVIEDIGRKDLYFSIGEHVFITNLPDNYTVVLTPLEKSLEIKRCVSVSGLCTIEVKYTEQPLECIMSVYNEKGQPVFRGVQPITVWGGDVYELLPSDRG